MNFKVILFVKA